MQITEVRIYLTDGDLVRAYVAIPSTTVFTILMLGKIRVSKGPPDFRLDACQEAETASR
jgi:DNA-binding cell septation regulator SpoVG